MAAQWCWCDAEQFAHVYVPTRCGKRPVEEGEFMRAEEAPTRDYSDDEVRVIFRCLANIPRTASSVELWDAAADIAKDYVRKEAEAEKIRAAQEAAWDEGKEAEAEAHFADNGYGNVQHPENPYRKEPS